MDLAEIRHQALAALIPPPRIALSAWIEQNIRLPEGATALRGLMRLWRIKKKSRTASATH
jgi:hypothetical protein